MAACLHALTAEYGLLGGKHAMDGEVLVGEAGSSVAVRPPPSSIVFLLPVWGYRFILQFLEYCLPTLLAPGNIPAVASSLPTRFLLLSREGDEDLIRSHPSWLALQQVCSADVACIDDLITDGNHTATITLAFARAVRQMGEAMTDIGFIFLMSDYLFADGAFRSVVNHFLNGASGILAGNFQIVAEDAALALQGSVDPLSRSLTISSRELFAWSLGHLHPATVANIVNFRLSHNFHTNRLLWRVDENTLIGRFYLIHPIGVRPEVTDFFIGSSLDYSFIPEMCPSGNVVTLTDSDDYFVVEMQPRRHERENLRPGPIKERELAVSLGEWTTSHHRTNAAQTIVYHAGELPPVLPDAVAEADGFVGRVAQLLVPYPPQPFRHHPYWLGSIASNRLNTGQALGQTDWRDLLAETAAKGWRAWIRCVWRFTMGTAPKLTRFHTRWPDYNVPYQAMEQVISAGGKVLLLAEDAHIFATWMAARTTGDPLTLEWSRLRDAQPSPRFGKMPEWYHSLVQSLDGCLLIITEPMLEDLGEVIKQLEPLLKTRSAIWLVLLNDRPYRNARMSSRVFASNIAAINHPSVSAADTVEATFVQSTRLRWLVYRAADAALQRTRDASRRRQVTLPLFAIEVGLLALVTCFVNLGVRSTRTASERRLWSSAFLTSRCLRPASNVNWPSGMVSGE